jgi:hypothetical protein
VSASKSATLSLPLSSSVALPLFLALSPSVLLLHKRTAELAIGTLMALAVASILPRRQRL